MQRGVPKKWLPAMAAAMARLMISTTNNSKRNLFRTPRDATRLCVRTVRLKIKPQYRSSRIGSSGLNLLTELPLFAELRVGACYCSLCETTQNRTEQNRMELLNFKENRYSRWKLIQNIRDIRWFDEHGKRSNYDKRISVTCNQLCALSMLHCANAGALQSSFNTIRTQHGRKR